MKIYDPLRHIDENLSLSGERWKNVWGGGQVVEGPLPKKTPEELAAEQESYCAFLRDIDRRWQAKYELWKAKQERR